MRPLYKQYLGAAAAGLFAAAVAVNLYANYLGDPFLANRSKPLLMPLLALTALLFFPPGRPRTEKWLLAAALAFGTAGDVLLMYSGQTFFLLGMAMFLLGHLCYLTLFAKMGLYRRVGKAGWLTGPSAMAAVACALVLAIKVPFPMAAPVAVYGFVLLLVPLSGLFARSGVLLLGGVLFAFSDSLIALRSFAGIRFFDHTGFVIMLTYITAQVLLSVAIIRWRPLPAGMRNNYKRMPIFVC